MELLNINPPAMNSLDQVASMYNFLLFLSLLFKAKNMNPHVRTFNLIKLY